MIVNIFTLGYWYAYDLVQLSHENTDYLNAFGMSGPFGPLGVAQGMWINEAHTQKGGNIEEAAAVAAATAAGVAGVATSDDNDYAENTNSYAPGQSRIPPKGTPSPWFFLLYCITISLSPLGHVVGGDLHGAFTRLLLIFPGMFLAFPIFIYMAGMIYDYFNLFINPADICIYGSKRIFPFTLKFWDKECHSPLLTGEEETLGAGFLSDILMFFIQNSPQGRAIQMAATGAQAAATKFVGPEVISSFESGDPKKLNEAIDKLEPKISLVKKLTGMFGGIFGGIPEVPTMIVPPLPKVPNIPTAQGMLPLPPGVLQPGDRVQAGGGEKTSLDYFIGTALAAVIGGGLLIGMNRNGRNDSPPEITNPKGW